MISFGAHFKMQQLFVEVMRDLDDANVRKDCIDSYPRDSLVNPFIKKYSWAKDEYLSFIGLE